jgi:hypothetical protein
MRLALKMVAALDRFRERWRTARFEFETTDRCRPYQTIENPKPLISRCSGVLNNLRQKWLRCSPLPFHPRRISEDLGGFAINGAQLPQTGYCNFPRERQFATPAASRANHFPPFHACGLSRARDSLPACRSRVVSSVARSTDQVVSSLTHNGHQNIRFYHAWHSSNSEAEPLLERGTVFRSLGKRDEVSRELAVCGAGWCSSDSL